MAPCTPLQDRTVSDHEHNTQWSPGKSEWCIMLTMSISSLLVALDSTILVPVLPTLAHDLKGTAQEAFWVGTSYLLANAVAQPFISAISNIFGPRYLLMTSITLFLVGSIVAGIAHRFLSFLAGRVVQGIGGGGIITLTQIVFVEIVPLRQRPRYFSLVLLAWATGSVLGPLIGGKLVESSAWRWCFYLNCPICAIAIFMSWKFVEAKQHRCSVKHRLAKVDWIGNVGFTGGLTSLLIAVTWGGVQYAWSSWQTLVPLVVGAVVVLHVIGHERFIATNPFLTKALFDTWSARCSYVCAMAQGIALYMALYYLPFYQITVQFQHPFQAGLLLLPALCCLLPGSAVVSILITRIGAYQPFVWIGWIVGTSGAGLFILFDETTSRAVWAVPLAIFGIGMGMVLSSVNFSAQAAVQPKDAGKAASMYVFMRSIGMCIGVAIGGGVFQNFMKSKCVELGIPAEYAVHAEALIAKIGELSNYERSLVLQAYVHGFKGVWEVLVGVCGAGLIAGFGIKHISMDSIL